jgi:hypothetical protein
MLEGLKLVCLTQSWVVSVVGWPVIGFVRVMVVSQSPGLMGSSAAATEKDALNKTETAARRIDFI